MHQHLFKRTGATGSAELVSTGTGASQTVNSSRKKSESMRLVYECDQNREEQRDKEEKEKE